MVRLRHFDGDGRVRFVTFSTYRRLPILSNRVFRQIVTTAIDEVRAGGRFCLLGWVLMPEHVHLVLLPGEGEKLGAIVGDLKRISARRIHDRLSAEKSKLNKILTANRHGRVRFGLWQPRCYDHNCRSEESVWQKVRYCHWNPVQRGLVSRPEEWIWSSYRWYRGLDQVLLEMDALPS